MKVFGKIVTGIVSVAMVSGIVSSSITSNTITTDTETKTETIFFQTETTYDNTLREGTVNIVQEGKNGSKTVTYLITYKGGKQINKEIQSSKIITEVVNAKKVVGTKKYYTCSNGEEFDTVDAKNECEKRISWETAKNKALAECDADPSKFNCWYDEYPGTYVHWTEYTAPNNSGYRSGAICRDGTRSYATGRGACSHHGGVSVWL